MQILKLYSRPLLFNVMIAIILISVLTATMLHVSALTPTIYIDPAITTVKVGEQFDVNISLDHAENLYGYELWLSFDNNKINATAIEYKGFLNAPIMTWYQLVNNTGGYVALAVSSLHPAEAKNGGSPPPLATVHFKCIGVGKSPLSLYKTIISDDQARAITHTVLNGEVNCVPSVVYDDVIFDSSFEMGNLINVQFREGDASGYRYYTAELNYSTKTFPDKHWWFYFSMENVTGKTIKVELKNLAEPDFTGLPSPGFPRWQEIEPVYSYDNIHWYRVPLENVQCGNNETRNFNITLTPTADKVWVAPIPPYTVTMRDQLFASYAGSPYLTVTSLGKTPLGLDLKLATITDPSVPNENKFIIYVIAQQHSGETVSSFVAEGMIRFLLNETDPIAARIRRSYIFKIIPIVNVEGVYYGISRYTPFRSGIQYDLNRQWSLSLSAMQPEVRWIFEDLNRTKPHAFLDLHSNINGESATQTSIDCFFLHDGLYDSVMINFLNNVSRGFDGTKDYWPETGSRSAAGSSTSTPNVRTRLGIHPAVELEHPHDSLRNSTAHPVDHNPQTIEDWKDWGRRAILGIFEYFGEITPPNRPPTIDSYYPMIDPIIIEGQSQEFNITYSDPDGDLVSVQWYLDGVPTVTSDSYTFVATIGSTGIYNVTVVVSDGSAQASHEWKLTVLRLITVEEITPCDIYGNPKNSFRRGTLANFKVIVKNSGTVPVNVLITVNIYDSAGVTIGVASFKGPISPGTSTIILGLPIPTTASLGETRVFAIAFTDWLHMGGIPYCPEVSSTFEITT